MTTSTSQRRNFLLYYYFSFDENAAADSETRKKATPFVLFLAEEGKPFETLLYLRVCVSVEGIWKWGKIEENSVFPKMEKILSSIITVSTQLRSSSNSSQPFP